jgi:hypothetical protein
MNTLWSYFWPCFAIGLVVALIAGIIAFRQRPRRNLKLAAGLVLALALTAAWHGPAGGADRFVAAVERPAREALNYYEVPQVSAHLHHGPLTRRLLLSGDNQLNDWQRGELARLFSQVPGVSRAQWAQSPAGPPLILEGFGVALLGFLFGLLLAYLIELRRRYNAQWNW